MASRQTSYMSGVGPSRSLDKPAGDSAQNLLPPAGCGSMSTWTRLSPAKSAALRLRRRYAEVVREEIAQTVASVAEIDEEIRYMVTVVSSS